MKINKKEVENHTGQVEIVLEYADLAPKVDAEIQKLRKKVQLPGFRPGRVPVSLIKKQYGPAVHVDVVDKLVKEALKDFTEKEKLELLGSYIPAEEQPAYDFKEIPEEGYRFTYDYAVAPEYELDYDELKKIPFYAFTHTDEDVDNEIENYRQRFGIWEEPGKFVEGSVLELIVANPDNVNPPYVYVEADKINKKTASELDKIKTDETFSMTFAEAKKKKIIDEKQAGNFTKAGVKDDDEITFRKRNYYKRQLPELNEEFFKKVFPDKEIKDEKAFREAVLEMLNEEGKKLGVTLFKNELNKKLPEAIKMDLPEAFLKRWLKETSGQEKTDEEIERLYKDLENEFKLDIVQKDILKKENLEITDGELKDEAKQLIIKYFYQNPQLAQYLPTDEQLEQMALEHLQDKNNFNRVYSIAVNKKVIDWLFNKLKPEPQEIKWKDYTKQKAAEKNTGEQNKKS